MDGETYLRRLVETRLRDIAEHPSPQEGLSRLGLNEVEAAGRALVAVGAIEAQRLRELMKQVADLLLERGLIKGEQVSATVSETLEAVEIGTDTPIEWHEALEQTTPELKRVIAIGREADPVREGRLIAISLDVWTDHFSFRHATLQESVRGVQSSTIDHILWEASDDVGTPYRMKGGGGRGGRPWVINSEDFAPAPPSEARSVTFVGRDFGTDEEIVRLTVEL